MRCLIALSLALLTTLPLGADGFIREYAIGDAGSGPAIVVVDEDDAVWVALAKSGKLARFRDGEIRTFDIGANSRPVGLAAARDAIWIAASYDNKILRFDRATHEVRELAIDAENAWPFVVAVGPDGSVWFSQRAGGRIGRLDPASGTFRHYELPTPNSGPAGLALDPSTGHVWLTESYADRIARLDPATGAVTEFTMSEKSTGLVSGPAGIAVDRGGGVWFAKLEGKLGHIARGASTITLIDTPAHARRPAGVAVDPRGDVWLVALDGNCLLRYEPRVERFTSYALPTGSPDAKPSTPPAARTARPFGIAFDRQGNLWFSEQYTGQLGVLDAAPPAIAIFSPGPTVRTATTLATAQALDRVSGVASIEWSVDGKPVPLNAGRLDVSELAAGPHTLRASAIDHAGHRATTETSFVYAPSPLAVRELIDRLDAPVRDELAKTAAALTGEDPHAALASLRAGLDAHAKSIGVDRMRSLRTAIDGAAESLGRNIEVRIVDSEPYFQPADVRVRPGDTVRFRYDPPSDGHSISHHLHRVEIDGLGVASPVLRAGESFAHRFEKSGEFAVRDLEKDKVRAFATIRVVAP
jgi:streptogramin lyase/plastocyanin